MPLQDPDVAFQAEPPASAAFARLLDEDSWRGCTESLAAMLNRFAMRSAPSDAPAAMPSTPHLPFTLLQFDWLLCDTVRNARGSIAHRVALLRWLLLPYLSRRHMRAPFQALADDSAADVCWACTLQATLLALDICRAAILCGPSHRWAALALLRHLRSDEYAARAGRLSLPAPGAAAGDDASQTAQDPWDSASAPTQAPPTLDLFERILERTGVLLKGVDTEETLTAVQAAISDLADWHAVLEAEDKIARMERALATGANDFLFDENVAEALTAAAQAGSGGGALQVACAMPAVAGAMWLEVCVVSQCADVQPGWQRSTWGGAAALVDSADGEGGSYEMTRYDALRLQEALAAALTERLAPWTGCGTTGCELLTVAADDVHSGGVQRTREDAAVGEDAAGFVVCARWCVDAPAITRDAAQRLGSGADDRATQTVAACMDAVVTAASDLIRCEPACICNSAGFCVSFKCVRPPLLLPVP